MIWSQHYAPLGGIGLSATVAAFPAVALLVLLAFGYVRAHLAAGIALFAALAIAVFVYGMPAKLALASAGFGAPVAISGALMIGQGFKPLEAAKLALIGNTAPVAFGGLGLPKAISNS